MATKSAALQKFTTAAADAFNARIANEEKHKATMSAKELDTLGKKTHSLRLYFAKASGDDQMAMMHACNVDTNFINEKGVGGKYVVKKVYELADYLCANTGKLDTYDLRFFRTLLNAALVNVALNKEQLKACINHNAVADETLAPLLFRIAGMHKGDETAEPQFGSSLASFGVWNMVEKATCADTAKAVYRLRLDAPATIAMCKRLGLSDMLPKAEGDAA